jgi:Ala-tRNA(Pro) deacylase
MSTATWVKDMLNQRGVAYEELHHPEAFTAQEVAQREHVPGHRVAKVVVVIADGKPVELILPATRRVLLGQVRMRLGAQEVRLATEQELQRHFADCELGAMPPLRHWQGVDVFMDDSMRVDGDIVFQAGTHLDAVRMRFEDWFALVNPRVDYFTAPVMFSQAYET